VLASTAGALAPASASTVPAPPAYVHVTNGSTGTYLTWASSGATSFQIEQATDSRFLYNRRLYVDRDGRDRQFTPYGLVKGRTYYWRVRALVGSSASPISATVRAAVAETEQRIRVEQFNVSNEDGTYEGGGYVPYWSQRRSAVAAIINEAHPDVLAVEEAAGWVAQVKGPRVADDIVTLLGSSYALAQTEIAPGQPGWRRTGDYLIYNSAKYESVGGGGNWTVGTSAGVAAEVYQVLRNRASGARFLLIGTHLAGTSGRAADDLRQTQTKQMLANAAGYTASHGNLPIVYAGDFNSHDGSNHVYDGPGVATRAAHVADAFKSAQVMVNAGYNSANNYYRTPPASGRSIDRIFASPGVGIGAWRQYLNLSNGIFVGVIPSDHNPIAADMTFPY